MTGVALVEKVERYERFLRAIASQDEEFAPILSGLGNLDALEWLSEQARNLLDGCEAECPKCSTPLHGGACVGEGEGEEGE